MVLMAAKLTNRNIEMVNEKAQSVGEIREPTSSDPLGYGRETVYLVRPMPSVHRVRDV